MKREDRELLAVTLMAALLMGAMLYHASQADKLATAHGEMLRAAPVSRIDTASPAGIEGTGAVVSALAPRTRTYVPPAPPKPVTPGSGDSTAPQTASAGWRTAKVSVYGEGDGLLGNPTANGDRLDATSLTFAHRSMAFGTRVTFRYGGREVTAYCNDRGPFVGGRTFDLAPGTRKALGMGIGVYTVEWR